MDRTQYSRDQRGRATTKEQTGQPSGSGHTSDRSGIGAGVAPWGDGSADAGATALPMVAANIRYGVRPRQLQAGIDAGNRQLGNRAFMHWVGRLQSDERFPDVHEAMAGGLRSARPPMTNPEDPPMSTGPAQVAAPPAPANAPLQMRKKKAKKKNTTRRENVSGPDMPAQEAASQEMISPAANQDILPPADHSLPTTGNLENQQAGTATGDVAAPVPHGLDVAPLDLAPLDLAPEHLGSPDPSEPASEAASREIWSVAGSQVALLDAEDGEIVADSTPEAEVQLEDLEIGDQAWCSYERSDFFPVTSRLHRHLAHRAGQIQTEDHAALSLPGIGNSLLTVLLGLLMAGVALPLDMIINLLGVMAIGLTFLCNLFFGKPAIWLLKRYLKKHPPNKDDIERYNSTELPKGPPRGVDWNISIPELVAISAISAYWQAGVTQSSLSPRRWLQPWTGWRIASIIFRTLVNDIVYVLQFTVFPKISQRLLQKRLGWGATRAGLFVSVLNNIFDVVSTYILSYLTNIPLAIYLVFQNLIEENDLSPSQAAAAVIGYAALGMFIQTVAEAVYEHFVVNRVNERNMVPWLREFRIIHDPLVRTIAIALASLRNVIVNVMAISLTTGQLSANIIGPLSTRFGQGGACFWPLAVAEVCGGPPSDFEQHEQRATIEAGEENMTFGQLFAIEIFPWLIALIGLGAPVAYVIYRYRRAKKQGRGKDTARPEAAGSEQGRGEDAARPIAAGSEQDREPGRTEPDEPEAPEPFMLPGETLASVEVHDDPVQSVVSDPDETRPAPIRLTKQELYEFLLGMERLTPSEMRRILREHVANGDISQEGATLIEDEVRKEIVLAREK